MGRIKIIGTGSYVPEKILTNADLEKMVNTSDEWITKRTGIKERHIASKEEATSDLGYIAATRAIENAKIDKNEIDMIIFGTVTPDHPFPSTAIYVQRKLGLKNIPAFDVNAACPGFIYGLYLTQSVVLANKRIKTVLLLGGEILTKITNWDDRGTCVLFGDGVGAAIIKESDDKSGFLSLNISGDGSMEGLLKQPAGGSRMPASEETVKKNLHTVYMNGNEVYKEAVNSLQQAAEKAINDADISVDDITHFIPHQANIRIMETTAKYLNIPREKVYINIQKYGNTSAGSIPIAMDEMNRKGLLKKGDIVLIDSFGAGFVWGAGIMRW